MSPEQAAEAERQPLLKSHLKSDQPPSYSEANVLPRLSYILNAFLIFILFIGALQLPDRQVACRTALDRLHDSHAQVKTIQKQLSHLHTQLNTLQGDFNSVMQELVVARQRIDRLQDQQSMYIRQISETKGHLNVCNDERDTLKIQHRIDLLSLSKDMGTGTVGWGQSKSEVRSFSYGWVSETSPDPSVQMMVWTATLDYHQTIQFEAGQRGIKPDAKIVGYELFTLNWMDRNDGWWRKHGLERFGDSSVSFESTTGRYEVKVYYV